MSVPPFYLYKPDSLDEALRCAVDLDGHFDFMGGGTDLLPGYTQGLNVRRNVISLTGISSLTRLSAFSIGACVTLADLIRHGDRLPPVISQTARSIAGPAIRESATVGGNMLLNGRCRFYNQSELSRCAHGACMKAEGDECLVVSQRETCYAIASGDLAPVFMVLGAHFRIEGPEGERLVSAADFFQPNGMKPTVMGSSDLLTEIVLPEDVNERDAEYVKLRPRSSVDFPEAGVA
ncbi:MAG: FAD binding domain-containing protein, partial [Rhodothermales bacterium]